MDTEAGVSKKTYSRSVFFCSPKLRSFGVAKVASGMRICFKHNNDSLESSLAHMPLISKILGVRERVGFVDSTIEKRQGLTYVVRSNTFEAYSWALRRYSTMNITYDKDAINAFDGLLRIFSFCMQSDTLIGLPETALDVALLWRPKSWLRPRDFRLLPSWSWAGWDGPTGYQDIFVLEWDGNGKLRRRRIQYDNARELKEGYVRPMVRWCKTNPEPSNSSTLTISVLASGRL